MTTKKEKKFIVLLMFLQHDFLIIVGLAKIFTRKEIKKKFKT